MSQASPVTAEASPFGAIAEPFGDSSIITLNSENMRVQLLSRGASINAIQIRDTRVADGAEAQWIDVCVGYTNPDEALADDTCVGATIGRYAGRIANAEFELKNSHYSLGKNCGEHNLHGGPVGFDKKEWKYLLSDGEDETGVAFHLVSPHLDQGFPGEVFITATYSIIKTAAVPTFKYVFKATLADNTPVDMTVVNLTNHVYWNLNGLPRPATPEATAPVAKLVTNHHLQLHARYFADTDADLIPNGDMRAVEGTAHDYTEMRGLAEGMEATREMGREDGGYDDPVALETWDSSLREAALLYSPATKLRMRVCTTNPAIIVYTANHFPKDADGTKGKRFPQHGAIALECQYFPNSPNVPAFPSTVLNKKETYNETTTHEFQFMKADYTHEEKHQHEHHSQ